MSHFGRLLALLVVSLLLLNNACSFKLNSLFAKTLNRQSQTDDDDPQASLVKAEKAAQKEPNSDKAQYALGEALFRLRRFSEALPHFQDAVRVNPQHDAAQFMIGETYDRLNKIDEARVALEAAIKLKPDNWQYRRYRDAMLAYFAQRENQKSFPKVVVGEDGDFEYAGSVYSGIFAEALVRRDFDFIDRAANEARDSKEKLADGVWKLQLLYHGLDQPYLFNRKYEWDRHGDVLQEWTRKKPNSLTASVALAAYYSSYAWNARGTGYANSVSDDNYRLFRERLKLAKDVLLAVKSNHVCPKWYSVMNEIALGQGWDRESYEELFVESVANEPTWYEYYKQRANYLLPRWYGEPGELQAYIDSFAAEQNRTDGPMIYFLVNERLGRLDLQPSEKPATNYQLLKQGFLDLRKTYGVSSRDTGLMFNEALQANDVDFAQNVFPQVKGGIPNSGTRVTKEMFDALAKKYAEQQQQKKTP